MDASFTSYLNHELKSLLEQKEIYERRLQKCNGAESTLLHESKRRNGNSYYYTKEQGSAKFTYAGNSNSPAVKKVREAHFICVDFKKLDSNIELIQSFRESYCGYDQSSVNDALAVLYRSSVVPMSQAYEKAASVWKADRLVFQARYPENYPEHKRERTTDGVMVKTISELTLYEMVKSAGLCAIYELPLIMGDYGPPMYPDLTVLSPIDLKTEIIIEYVGRLDLPKYREDFARKIDRYMANGYIPGVNLFFVYGSRDGHIDAMQIRKVIEEIKGL